MDSIQSLHLGQEIFVRFQTQKEDIYNIKNVQDGDITQLGRKTFEDYKAGLLDVVMKPAMKIDAAHDVLESLINLPVTSSPPKPTFAAEETVYAFEFANGSATAPAPVAHHEEKSLVESRNLNKVEKMTNSEKGSTHDSDSVAVKQMERLDRKTNFGVLQEHINVLTEENCELRRALELQQRLTENLTSENQHLSDEYNTQGQKMEEMQTKCTQYETVLKEQQETMGSLLHGHEASKHAKQGAQEQVKILVQENVELEDKLRDVRISEIKLQKMVDEIKYELAITKKQEWRTQNENRNLTDILNNIREENNVLRSQIQSTSQEMIKRPVQWSDVGCQTENAFVDTLAAVEEDVQKLSDAQILVSLVHKNPPELNPEESAVLSSIQELLSALEDQRRAMIAKLRSTKSEIDQLKTENAHLTHQLHQHAKDATNHRPSVSMGAHSNGESLPGAKVEEQGQSWFGFRRGRRSANLLE